MRQQDLVRNPFMLMLEPEQVLAAVERSEKLGRLNRRMCHPLDRPMPVPPATATRPGVPIDDDERLDG
jgi:hypothetical protein